MAERRTSTRGGRARALRTFITGLLFASPWIAGFLIFQVYPILSSAFYSLTDFNLFQRPHFVGLANYREQLDDARFWKSLYNTLYLTVIGVPLSLAFALLCALALNLKMWGQPLYRALVFLPTVVPVVAATYLWRWLLNAQYGYINTFLDRVGAVQPLWLRDPLWTKPALIIGLWGIGGTTVIYLAALQEVPQTYYEAASIDGAGPIQKFWHITWPAISPVTLFQLVIGIIAVFQYFTQAFILGQTGYNQPSGGPQDSMLMYGLYLFQNAFVFLKMGYASAMAWVLFLLTLLVTLLVLKSAARWVHYGGE